MNDDTKDAARQRLKRAVLVRAVVRSTYHQSPPGSYDQREARRQLQVADTTVRRAVFAGRANGLSRVEMAGVVGVSVSRIADILKAPTTD
ncbi:hypothetical protein [Embleya sp. AB8]|uniref:hypothetical protein n=1 Tax=Embleya sp. AB8 TaxID=3156304 RepID=UPI003C70C5B5